MLRFVMVVAMLSLFPLGAARAQPVEQPLEAAGNEPFWSVVVQDGTLTLDRLGFDPVILTVVQRAEMDGFAFVAAAGPARAVRSVFLLMPGICRDTMSGMPHPQTAQISLGDQSYRGCGGQPRSLLLGAEWQVTDIAGTPVIENSRASLAFGPEGRLSGNGSCNRILSRYDLTGEGLRMDPQVASTRMACPDAVMAQEQAMVEALGRVTGFDFDDSGALILRAPDGPALRAQRKAE